MSPREAPFFVVGSPRSGTTLVRRLLCAHPRLHLPGETGFVPFLRVDPCEVLSPPRVAEVLRRIGSLNRFWSHTPNELERLGPESRLEDLLGALYDLRARAYGAERWGDKTPGYVRYIPAIAEIFPDCQIIHIIRDGRDVALSAYAQWGANHWYMDLHYLLRQWEINVRTGRQDGERLGAGRYLEVRYEVLVRRPREVMETVLTFLGETWDDAVGEVAGSSRSVAGARFHANVHRPVSDASAERWRRQLAPRQAKLADSLVGELLCELGYPSSELGPLSLGERLTSVTGTLRYALAGPARSLLYAAGVLTLNRGLRPGGKGT